MHEFAYHRPSSVDEALGIYEEADDGLYLAGGQTLIPVLKQRLAMPSDVIDLSAIDALNGLSEEDDAIRVGAMTSHAAIAASELVAGKLPALAKLASHIGDPHVRNRGTLGGSIANADPAADYPAAIVGTSATVHTNRREIPADDFFTGFFETALEEGELVTHVVFPIPDKAAYAKAPNPASRYAMVGVFAAIGADGPRIAVTGAAGSVYRIEDMEYALRAEWSADRISDIIIETKDFNDDMHASADYRAHLVSVMARRAVAAA